MSADYIIERDPFEDRCPGCDAPRVETDTNVVRIHRRHCPTVGIQLRLPEVSR